jgi:plasmid stabilization system protein ParE
VKRYILARAAARDLVEIWRYIKKESAEKTADRVESVIREKLVFLAGSPGTGHRRRDLTGADVRFFPVYSYLIVYRPDTTPLQVAAILDGARDVAKLLLTRLH